VVCGVKGNKTPFYMTSKEVKCLAGSSQRQQDPIFRTILRGGSRNRRTEGERGTQIPSPTSEIHTSSAKGNRAAEIDTESKGREPIFSPVSAMQTAAKLKNRDEGERGTQIPSPASAMPTEEEGNRAAESDTESKRREPIFSPVSEMQTEAKLNSRAESNRGTHLPSPTSSMQTARQEDTRQLKSTDTKRRTEILSPASITLEATVGFKATPLATTTLPESKHIGLDTVVISITTDEENTPMGLVITAKDGAVNVQDYLHTVSTSIAAPSESSQVGLATVANAAGEAGTST
jgi:hypothetical protein